MKNIKTTRAFGFAIDYIIWYLLMYVMILFYFFIVLKEQPFSGDLEGYAEVFERIMKRESFVLIYLLGLIVYEIAIPLLMGGQSISKKILKTEINPFTVLGVTIRGLVKIIIINPCGVISFLLALAVGGNASILADALWVVLILNVVLVLMGKPSLQDLASKTTVVYK